MQLRVGQGATMLLDDTYNANSRSMLVALQTAKKLATLTGGRSLAVLGDMTDLGKLSRQEHEHIGQASVRMGVDVLVGCGREMGHATGHAARLSGGRLAPHPTRVAHVLDPMDAVSIVKSLWRPGDVVLIKGSRAMAMERIANALTLPDTGEASQP